MARGDEVTNELPQILVVCAVGSRASPCVVRDADKIVHPVRFCVPGLNMRERSEAKRHGWAGVRMTTGSPLLRA
jgi:hypothetical protein